MLNSFEDVSSQLPKIQLVRCEGGPGWPGWSTASLRLYHLSLSVIVMSICFDLLDRWARILLRLAVAKLSMPKACLSCPVVSTLTLTWNFTLWVHEPLMTSTLAQRPPSLVELPQFVSAQEHRSTLRQVRTSQLLWIKYWVLCMYSFNLTDD